MSEDKKVRGIICLKEKLYVALENSTEILIFNSRDPKNVVLEDKFVVAGMAAPSDLTCFGKQELMFVSDVTENCLWEIRLLDRGVSKWPMQRKPNRISISYDDNLLVVSSSLDGSCDAKQQFLDMYDIDDPQNDTSHPLPRIINILFDAVQLLTRHVIITYESKQTKNNLVSEISTDGTILRSFILSSAKPLSTAESFYLCVNDKDGVYIADSYSNEILYFDTRLELIENLSLVSTAIPPARLCYSTDESYQMLFVGTTTLPGSVSTLYNERLTQQTCGKQKKRETDAGMKMLERLCLSACDSHPRGQGWNTTSSLLLWLANHYDFKSELCSAAAIKSRTRKTLPLHCVWHELF